MDRFLRPKRKADAIPLSEELAGASQPSESRPDTRGSHSEAYFPLLLGFFAGIFIMC